jgi:hypothetical protein
MNWVWPARDALVVNKHERSDAIDHSRLHREISSIISQFIKCIFFWCRGENWSGILIGKTRSKSVSTGGTEFSIEF